MTSSYHFNPGSGPYTLCCCTVSLESLKNLFGLAASGPYIRIGAAGAWKKPPVQKTATPPSFYGHIRFSGVMEPMSGKLGLGFIPQAVVYCGTDMTFLDALEHFKSHSNLHAYSAIYLEKHSRLTFLGGQFLVEGRPGDPGMVIMQPKTAEDPAFKVSILIPGGRFKLAETQFEIWQA
jgi:hypothetical protein